MFGRGARRDEGSAPVDSKRDREQAEKALRFLDGYVYKGRTIRVRFSRNNAHQLKVRNLCQWVTNELLKKAFTIFGEVERAEIIIENGKPSGEAVLEFADFQAGATALKACVDGCFVLTGSLQPVILEEMDNEAALHGYSEKHLPVNRTEYKKIGPRFAREGTQEYDFALLYKSLYERRRQIEEEFLKKWQTEEEELKKNIKSIMNAIGSSGN